MASFPLSNDPGYNSCDQNATQEALLWEQNPTMHPIQAQGGGYPNVNEYSHGYIQQTNPQLEMYQGSNPNQMHASHTYPHQAGDGMNVSPLLSPNQNHSFHHFRSHSHRTSSPYTSPIKYGPSPTTNQMQGLNLSQPHGYHQIVGEKHVVSSLPTPPTGNQAGQYCLPHQGDHPFGGSMNGSQINYVQNQSRYANHFHTPTKGNPSSVVEMHAPALSIRNQGHANQILSPQSQNAFSMSGTTLSLSKTDAKNNQSQMEECMSDSEQSCSSSSSSSSSSSGRRRRRKAKTPKRKLTKEEKRKAKAKRIKNKIAAQKSRKKQKDRISWLEKENAELQLSISSMKTFTETYYHNLDYNLQSAGCPPNGIPTILNSAHNFFMAIKNMAAKCQENK